MSQQRFTKTKPGIVVAGERGTECRTLLMEVSDFANPADAAEGRRVLDDRCNLVVQL